MRISDWSSDVCSSDLLSPRYAANARNDSRAGHFAVVHVAGGKLADFKEGRTSVEQALHAFAGQTLAPGDMTLPILLRSTESGLCPACIKFIPHGVVRCVTRPQAVAARRFPAVTDGRKHATQTGG